MEFSYDDLIAIQRIFNRAGQWGPTTAYREWFNVPKEAALDTTKVEVFAISLITQYNLHYHNTY